MWLFFLVSTIGIGFTLSPTLFQSCNFLINFINKRMILPPVSKKLFDHVIVTNMSINYNRLPRGVLNNYLPGYYGETFFGKYARNMIGLFGPLCCILRFICFFIINMIPFVGPFIVILIKASRSGFRKHRRYFQLKGYTKAQIYYIWVHRRHNYFIFGVVALLLESIPIIGYLFIFTNTISAALWAIDIEEYMFKSFVEKAKPELVYN